MTKQTLPTGWVWTTLGDVAAWGSGGTPKRGNPSYFNGDIPWAVIGDLDDGPVIRTAESITSAGLAASSAKIVPIGSVLVAMYGASIGKLGLTTREITTNQAIAAATPFEDALDAKYLHWFLTEQKPALVKAGKGGAQPNIGQGVLKEWHVPLPPLSEQHRIVEALDDHLSRLDASDASVSVAMRRAKALDTAIRRASVSVTPDTETLPNGWVWQTLDDLSSGSSYGTSTKCDAAANGTPVIRIPNIKAGHLDFNDMKHAVDCDLDLSSLYLGPGDLLFVRTNGSPALIGRTAVVRDRTEMAFASYLIRFRLDSIELAEWVQLVLSTQPWRHQIMKAAASSAGQYNLNQKFLKSLLIPVPPSSERQAILDAVNESADDVRRLTQLAPTLQARSAALRRSLLRAAFKGELVDQNPADEPADVALGKIREQQSGIAPRRRRKVVAAS